MLDIIGRLCHKYTDLTEEEIGIIQNMAKVLPTFADLEEADVFIDCPACNGDAIVVAEAKPSRVPSSYKKSVVGLPAKQENEPAVARTLRLGIGTRHMKAVTQENGCTVQSVEPIRNGNRIIGVLISEKRTNEQIQLDDGLHLSRDSCKTIANNLAQMIAEDNWLTECIDEALIMVDVFGIVAFRNRQARELYQKLGFVEDILGQPYKNVCLADLEVAMSGVREYAYLETTIGSKVLSTKCVQLDVPGMDFAVILRDITLQKEQEKALILKSVAIKEMHHRVKNNLQTIASLLRLQMRRTDGEETRQVLGESMNRILSIASTHQLLAQSGIDEVMIGEVIQNITSNALRYYSASRFYVETTLEGDAFHVSSDVATSVALIINELVENAMKYAFKEGDSGLIRIIVSRGELYSQIQVIDNGKGFDVKNTDCSRLGLSIVRTLVRDKLHGDFEIDSDSSGTRVRFDFRNKIMDTTDVT